MNKDSQTFDEKFSLALIEAEVRAILLGGVACNIYGSTRYSEDIDWWVEPSPDLDAWSKRLLSVGCATQEAFEIVSLRIRGPVGKINNSKDIPSLQSKVSSIIREDALVRFQSQESKVDLFYLPNHLEDFQLVWERSKPWDGTLRVLSIEDLILTKSDTGRQKDEDDIRFLKSQKG